MALSAFIATIIPVFIDLKFGACQPNTYISTGFGNNQYGTKTAYFWTYPKSEHVKNKLMKITMDGRTCNAVHVNLVSRHGARYTSVEDMRSFSALKQKLKHNFTNKTYNFINNWVSRYPEEKETLISALGQREMAYLGKHFGTELHDLLNGTVSTDGTPISVQFAATRKTRTQESAKYFFRGLTDVLLGQNLRETCYKRQDSSYTKGMFQFGHSDTITDLAAGLGLFNDSDSLRADNYYAMQNRKCRASILDPFSTHFAFILYNCGGTGIDNYALKLFFNGKPISIPKCNSEACWYKDVRLGYKQFIDGCDLDSICAVEHTPGVIG
ncbi:uncharacterized protein LOC128545930 [Mercenaria mercenaria]|uniref:uncharacterized protein LOC128545930 n=1 Tax=Mercenaria mercenaria TaxID=6596 RepID=UPI00234F19C4|nr:uncharacterized protein LOC128545930 [Mercenaria mercenaria]